jgi:hypothetical protein
LSSKAVFDCDFNVFFGAGCRQFEGGRGREICDDNNDDIVIIITIIIY